MTFPSAPPTAGSRTPPADNPASSLWPDPTPEPPSRFPEGLVLGTVVLLSAALVLGGLFGWSRWQDRGAEEAATEPTPGSAPSNTGPPPTSATPESAPGSAPSTESPPSSLPRGEHAICPDGVPPQVCSAAAFVETQRGRPFKEFPAVELVDDDGFAERLLRDFDEARAEIDITTEVWRSLGFIGSDVDLFDALSASYEVGVVGVYFTDTKELYIQGTDLNLYAELVIVHELTHAHDDQWLNLEREEYEDSDDEIGYGFSAVAEGNARRVENAWRNQLSSQQEQELSVLEIGILSPEEIEIYLSLPRLLLEFQISPYQDGLDFVTAVAAAGGEDAVNDAFANPPRTSEQVLHPELFVNGELGIPVDPPPAEADIIDEGLVGELAFDLWWGDQVGDGWGGDYYVTWATESGACTRIDVVGDTEADTDEFFAAADSWSRDAEGRSVQEVDGLVRLTGCY